MKRVGFGFLIVLIFYNATTAFSKEVPFTLEDRDRIIRLEAKLDEIDKRFEQIDKRFEQIDKRFEQVISFLWILTTIFIAITSATIGFAFWDRKTSLKPIEEKVTINEKKLEHALAALRKLASVDKKVHAILKEFNLL
ncbi:MAG TPA: hypothetical protein PLZ38_11040 [Spirochaetota bacterium]|nr:hypothetical protein [Spirochaetota bacterium]HOR94499.1 hypothetical protein [Spirochaetota bacterium]HOT19549.1 hypothetical protein [Spirochaetota bacterium]HPD03899.1 hypothetical protein [Spirochaetota bacterium]HRR60377.1 hypothetical protein [Spirochaetota bacterium]